MTPDPDTMSEWHRRTLEQRRRPRPPFWTANRVLILLLILVGIAGTVTAFWQAGKAHGSIPSVIFSGMKPIGVWKSESAVPGMTWEELTVATCVQEQGFLAVTESEEGVVYFTCILRIDARSRQEA